MEGTLDDFIDQLVSAPPRPDKSIQLELGEKTEDDKETFKSLIEIFTKVMKYIYGDNQGVVKLESLSDEDLNLVDNYFKSFGIKIYYEVFSNSNQLLKTNNSEKNFSKFPLKDHCLNLKTSIGTYKIFFDYL